MRLLSIRIRLALSLILKCKLPAEKKLGEMVVATQAISGDLLPIRRVRNLPAWGTAP